MSFFQEVSWTKRYMHFSPKCNPPAAYYMLHFTPVTTINQQFKWRNFSFCNIIQFPMSLSFPSLNTASSSNYRLHNFSNKNHYVCTTNDRTAAVLNVPDSNCKFISVHPKPIIRQFQPAVRGYQSDHLQHVMWQATKSKEYTYIWLPSASAECLGFLVGGLFFTFDSICLRNTHKINKYRNECHFLHLGL